MSTPTVKVTRNWGDGFVAATVGGERCVLTRDLAKRLGCKIPRPVLTTAWRPDDGAPVVRRQAVTRVPFWRRRKDSR